jgi:hypothetical protein
MYAFPVTKFGVNIISLGAILTNSCYYLKPTREQKQTGIAAGAFLNTLTHNLAVAHFCEVVGTVHALD